MLPEYESYPSLLHNRWSIFFTGYKPHVNGQWNGQWIALDRVESAHFCVNANALDETGYTPSKETARQELLQQIENITCP